MLRGITVVCIRSGVGHKGAIIASIANTVRPFASCFLRVILALEEYAVCNCTSSIQPQVTSLCASLVLNPS